MKGNDFSKGRRNSRYDIIVIGAGSGGLSLSLVVAKVGLRVLLIDKSADDIGGECLNDGCVPSKALIHVSKIIYNAKKAESFGLRVSGKMDIGKVNSYVQERKAILREHENVDFLEKQGIEVVLGTASFVGRDSVVVNEQRYRSKRIVLATGSRPRKLEVRGMELVRCYDNESLFDIRSLAPRWLVVGGGPVGIEMAQAIARLGAEVTVVLREEMILPHDNQTVTGVLFDQLRKEGITFITRAWPEQFVSSTEAILKNKDGKEFSVFFDAVFVAIGRDLDLQTLNLFKAGIEVANGRIKVNNYLQTTNPSVFACGDIAGRLKFSHVAEYHARVLLNNFFSPFKKKLSNKYLSWVTFSDPELATFGLSERQLEEQKVSFEKLELPFSDDDRAVIDGYRYGKLVLYIGKKGIFGGRKILGGTMIAPHAGEMIQELQLMCKRKLNMNTLFRKIYAYPVASRVNQSIVIRYQEGRLTDGVYRILRSVYRLLN